MKNYKTVLFTFLALFCMLYSCHKNNQQTRTYTIYKPVYKARSTVLAAINGNVSQPVETAGKIYIRDNFIYLNEVDKGIHIIDNSTPARPIQIAFLAIPGNLDIAVKENILYADMYGDLLAIDIINPKKVKISSIIKNFFTERMYINGTMPDSTKVIVDWIKKDTTVPLNSGGGNCDRCFVDLNAGPAPQNAKAAGVAGSMASMVLINDYLYAITERHNLGIVNVRNASSPVAGATTFAGMDLQTIYPFKDKLFLGSAIGMFIYDISNPEKPVSLGRFSHGRACDPVISDGDYAYVTLHAGSECGGSDNELNVINTKDLMNPSLIKSYPLTKPTGLCKDGNLLFICDGSAGVRVYDASKANDLQLLQKINNKDPYDIIAGNKHALVIAKDGLYQYDYTNVNHIRQLSFFSLKK
jgi:hypothetical protein